MRDQCNGRLCRLALWRTDQGAASLWRRGADPDALERDGSPLAMVEALATFDGLLWLPEQLARALQNPLTAEILVRQRRLLVSFVRFRLSVNAGAHHIRFARMLNRAGLASTPGQVKQDYCRFTLVLDIAQEPVLPAFLPSSATLQLLGWTDLECGIAFQPGDKNPPKNVSEYAGPQLLTESG